MPPAHEVQGALMARCMVLYQPTLEPVILKPSFNKCH